MAASRPLLLSGTANPALAVAVAGELGFPLAAAEVERFPDGEVTVRLLESVRRREVVVVQPTAPPADPHLMELLAFADACRRAAAARVVAVVPYFGYARADRRGGRREPVTASLVATLMQAAGVDHVVTVDLHTPQVEGFFRIPVDSLTALVPLCDAVGPDLPEGTTVVSPDAGRVPLATEYARRLRLPLAVLHKRRDSATETEVAHLVGEVEGRHCLLVDDMISTGGTLRKSVAALRDAGATGFTVTATHGLLIGDALARLVDAGIERVYVTDTVRVPGEGDPALRVVPVAPLLADALRHLTAGADEGAKG